MFYATEVEQKLENSQEQARILAQQSDHLDHLEEKQHYTELYLLDLLSQKRLFEAINPSHKDYLKNVKQSEATLPDHLGLLNMTSIALGQSLDGQTLKDVVLITNSNCTCNQLLSVDTQTFDVLSTLELKHPALCSLKMGDNTLVVGERRCIEIINVHELKIEASIETIAQVNKILPMGESLVALGQTWGIIEFIDLRDLKVLLQVQIKSQIEGQERALDNHISDMVYLPQERKLAVATNNGLFFLTFTQSATDNCFQISNQIDQHLAGMQIKTLSRINSDLYLLGLTLEPQPQIYQPSINRFLPTFISPPYLSLQPFIISIQPLSYQQIDSQRGRINFIFCVNILQNAGFSKNFKSYLQFMFKNHILRFCFSSHSQQKTRSRSIQLNSISYPKLQMNLLLTPHKPGFSQTSEIPLPPQAQ